MRILIIVVVSVVALVVLVWNTMFFTVHQTQMALVTRFQQPVRVVTEPGLGLLVPFVEKVTYFDKRVLYLDAPTEEVTSLDQKRLLVDAFARYRIVDPLKFYQSVTDIQIAKTRLASMLNSSLRSVLAGQMFSTLLSGERGVLMHRIRDLMNAEALGLGVEVVDVRIRRADLPDQNSQAIFGRMQTERQREAAELRAQGQEASAGIRSTADKDVAVILAEANRKSSVLRGEGDGERARIFAEAFGQDPDFFQFYRTMRAYDEALGASNTTMVLKPDSDFFRFFRQGAGRPAGP